MKAVIIYLLILFACQGVFGQSAAEKIYQTERAFEKMAAEKGLNAAFIEFLAPDGIMFSPEAVNGREMWRLRPASSASLTWNPVWIDVSTNGSYGYSIGNSVLRPKGTGDAQAVYGHYLSIWSRQQNGEYKAVLDTGINHEKPATSPTDWKSPSVTGVEKNDRRLSAADSAVGFYESIKTLGPAKAYKNYLTDDAYLLRAGKEPFVGKKAAMGFLQKEKLDITFAKRKSFFEAGDMAYVTNVYALLDKSGKETERGNFVQVWKLREGKWMIAVDVFIPVLKEK